MSSPRPSLCHPPGQLAACPPGAKGHTIVARLLLLLLTELLRELLDFPALHAVAPRVVHQAPWIALITARGLSWLLVTT
jgi:hypothetical protein